jgi:GNAT superfamily N-acetyltransferase
MPITYVSRFPVDDAVVGALHARAFGSGAVEAVPWAHRLSRHAVTWIGAFDGDDLVGFVQVCWDGGVHAFLLDTAVDPARQHHGIGTGLVGAAIADATAAGCGVAARRLRDRTDPVLSGRLRLPADRGGSGPARAGNPHRRARCGLLSEQSSPDESAERRGRRGPGGLVIDRRRRRRSPRGPVEHHQRERHQ